MKQFFLLTIIIVSQSFLSYSQPPTPFTVSLESVSIPGFPGLHSFHFSQHQGKWLIIGGRKDGMHLPQPGAFPAHLRNDSIFVVQPETQQVWKSSLSVLPDSIYDQLSSTNANFITEHGYLFVIGGYGYSADANMKITFPYLTAIRVDSLINAVINDESILPWIKSIRSDYFKVTGGRLNYFQNHFYLAFGHLFDGEVAPIPVIAGDTVYWQRYTFGIKKFDIYTDGNSLSFTPLEFWTDTPSMRRRDYNLVKQIFPNRQPGLTAFSGVFPIEFVGAPYLEPINIDSAGFEIVNSFQQKLNHYHCATIPVYDSLANTMHTLFFGGVAQYIVDSAGNIVQDQGFPFVKTIARVTRKNDGTMEEVKLNPEMPGFLGSGSEFIVNESLNLIENEIIDLNKITEDISVAGYIVGGVRSNLAYAMSFNPELNSSAEPTVYRVKLIKGNALGEKLIDFNPSEMLNIKIFPNPAIETTDVSFYLADNSDVTLWLICENGIQDEERFFPSLKKGINKITLHLNGKRGVYLIKVKSNRFTAVKKIVVE